ncbi:F0F1 ATP synthase subunit A [candidate division KSB1 bacterium]|nr:F0F1 ATP synthase subunit A [candidate division KSB1 bacterium]
MKLLAKTILLVIFCSLIPVATANVPATDRMPAAADSATAASAAEGGAAHTEHEGGIGTTLVRILEHHLVDADKIDLFGYEIHLPVFEIGGMTFVTKHQVWWLIAMLIVFALVWRAGKQTTAVPTGMRNVFEILATFIRDEILRPNLHEKADTFLPYFLTLFTCILFSNLLGLLPWGASATGNIGTTAGLALCTLGLMTGMGIKENGIGGFLHSFAPPGVPGWLMPLIIVVEIASFFIRPFALTIRLFANMLAGHAVIAVLLGLIVTPLFAIPSIAVATGVMLLEIVVALIQAYIFIMLSAVFIGLAVHPH